MGAHKNSFANRIRTAAMELSGAGATFTFSELSLKAGLWNRNEEKKAGNALRDFIKAGEAKRLSRAVYIYTGKPRMVLPLKEQMRNLLKIKKTVSIDELRELGAAESYAMEWLLMLVRRGVVQEYANGRYELIADMDIPDDDDKATRLRDLRARKKKAIIDAIDAAQITMNWVRTELREL